MHARSLSDMTAERRDREQFGRRSERLAALWLRLLGWRICAERVRVGAGEIDLIARRHNVVAFIEVKARKKAADLDFAIDARRLARVAAAVNAVAHLYAKGEDIIRIDVLLLAPWHWPRHLVNVWQP